MNDKENFTFNIGHFSFVIEKHSKRARIQINQIVRYEPTDVVKGVKRELMKNEKCEMTN